MKGLGASLLGVTCWRSPCISGLNWGLFHSSGIWRAPLKGFSGDSTRVSPSEGFSESLSLGSH